MFRGFKLCIWRSVFKKQLKSRVKEIYSDFWRPALFLIRGGYLTYKEAMDLTDDELAELTFAVNLIESEIADAINKKMKKGR